MTFSQYEGENGLSRLLAYETLHYEPTTNLPPPHARELRSLEHATQQEITPTQEAFQLYESWGGDPTTLEEIASLCRDLSYNHPERKARNIFRGRVSITPSPGRSGIVKFADYHNVDPDQIDGECSELRAKLYLRMFRAGLVSDAGHHIMGICTTSVSGQADKFFVTPQSVHTWLGLQTIWGLLNNTHDESIVIDPSLRVISSLRESGYKIGKRSDAESDQNLVFLMGSEVGSSGTDSKYAISRLLPRRESFIVVPEGVRTKRVRDDAIMGITIDGKYIVALGLCLTLSSTYEWFATLVDQKGDEVCQIILNRNKDRVPTGLSVATFNKGFKARKLEKSVIAQIYQTLIAGEECVRDFQSTLTRLKLLKLDDLLR